MTAVAIYKNERIVRRQSHLTLHLRTGKCDEVGNGLGGYTRWSWYRVYERTSRALNHIKDIIKGNYSGQTLALLGAIAVIANYIFL